MHKYLCYHFFLGGHDAEMMEIKNILSIHGYPFEDADLQWDNAKVSAYRDKLASFPADKIPVLIELGIDMAVPDNKKIIDHHGKNAGSDKKTSLEQIAELLQIQLTRDQQLISANDRGHIRCMLAIGAKPEEILEIRALDRKAQNINEQDYLFADEAISQTQEPFPGVALIASKTNRTAAIIDKIWNRYQTIIIKAPGEIHVSGPGKLIEALKAHYKKITEAKPDVRSWSGGMLPSYGYFGSNYFGEKEVIKLAQENTQPVSQHVFLFPFKIKKWEKRQDSDKISSSTNPCASSAADTNIEEPKVVEIFNKLENSKLWRYEPFHPFKTPQHYNEYSYFHDYARDALFNTRYEKKIKSSDNDSIYPFSIADEPQPLFVSCLLRRLSDKGVFQLNIKKKKKVDGQDQYEYFRYTLQIDGISIRLFETGVMILALELLNYEYDRFDDIQRINDYGRRVYPQFLGPEDKDNEHAEVDAVKYEFLADSITIFINNEKPIAEDFLIKKEFLDPEHLPPHHLHIGKHITKILGECFSNTYRMEPIIDDRMFTLCWYRGDNILTYLTKEIVDKRGRGTGQYRFETSEAWYKYVFLDGGKNSCCPDKIMQHDMIKSSTYRRWNQYCDGSSLYGLSRYSIVAMTGADFIRTHMRRQYRLMAEILLAQRASIVTFFHKVSELSRKIDNLGEPKPDEKPSNKMLDSNKKDIENICKEISDLNINFLGFKNRLWFNEITPQEQGIEMYDMAMKNMGLEKQMEELKDEIKELYEYAEMQSDKMRMEQEKKQSEEAHFLTWLAAIAIPISILLSFWGMSFGDVGNNHVWFGISIVISLLVIVFILYFKKIIIEKLIKQEGDK